MPNLYMLVGLPGVGKSTYLETERTENSVVLSTDAYIEQVAEEKGTSYNEEFKGAIKAAEHNLKKDLAFAISNDMDIYWDQTNLTAKSRARKLAEIPDNYRCHAIHFHTPDKEEHARRLNRPGKTIPGFILKNMQDTKEPPTVHEGFESVTEIKQ